MSFQDPPGRRRPPRYQVLAQYQEVPSSYQDAQADHEGANGYQGFAGLTDVPPQGPPWDDPWQRTAWDTGAQQPVWDAGSQQALRDSGPQRSSWDSGPQRATRSPGAHRSPRSANARFAARSSGAQPAARTTSGQAEWDASAQETSWDLTGQQTTRGLPRRTSGGFRALPEDGHNQPRAARQGEQRRRGGLLAGAVAGFLAAAVALGVANLVAAFVRPQASPIIAVGEAFIDRTPPALKNFAVEKFGENDKNMLLLGMYVTIALIAIAIGVLAWRRLWIGIAGIGLFGLFGAFVAITRPESHVTDVIPSIAGGIAGVAAIVVLVHAGMPRTRAVWARRR